jgi:hypothetical protein
MASIFDCATSGILSVASFNMHGFKSGFSQLFDLCKFHDLIAVQEHWLREDEFCKFNSVNDNFQFTSVCGMKSVLSSGVLVGRPFGGIAILWNKRLSKNITFLSADQDGRCLAIKVDFPSSTIIVVNVYFPCSERSSSYRSEISYYVGFIDNILSNNPCSKVIITGDMNFDIDNLNDGYLLLSDLLAQYNLVACDNLSPNPIHTYHNEALQCSSNIDHFLYQPLFIQQFVIMKLSIVVVT